MNRKSVRSTGIRESNSIRADIAATLAGIPTGESISRQAFTVDTKRAKSQSLDHVRAMQLGKSQETNRFIRTHRHHATSNGVGTVTSSYHELTRKLRRRQKMQRFMALTVMLGFVAAVISVTV